MLFDLDDSGSSFGFSSLPKEVEELIAAKMADMVYAGLIKGDIRSDAKPEDVIQMIDMLLVRYEGQEAYEKCKELIKVKQKYQELCC
jgi:hypothetical protein